MGRVSSEKMIHLRLRQRVIWVRMSLLAMVVITLVNQFLLALGVDYHFLLSAAAPYYLNWVCEQLGLDATVCGLAAAFTAGLYAAYFVCWLLSRRHRGGLLAALGLYAVDTLLLIIFAATLLKNTASCALEILAHMGILALLVSGNQAAGRLSIAQAIRRTKQKEGTYDKLQPHGGQAVPSVSGKPDQNRPLQSAGSNHFHHAQSGDAADRR